VFLLALPKGTLKKGKGKGKEEFPEHWIFPLRLAPPPAKEREKGKCNQAEWKRTPNSTHASHCDVLAEIWATRDMLSATTYPVVLHIKGHQAQQDDCL